MNLLVMVMRCCQVAHQANPYLTCTHVCMCMRRSGTEPHSQWHVDRVEVVHQASGMRTTFKHGAWIERGGRATLTAGQAEQVRLRVQTPGFASCPCTVPLRSASCMLLACASWRGCRERVGIRCPEAHPQLVLTRPPPSTVLRHAIGLCGLDCEGGDSLR